MKIAIEPVQLPPAGRRALLAVLWLLGGALAGSTLVCSPLLRTRLADTDLGEVLQDSVYVLSVILVLARVLLVPRARAAWALLAGALTSYGTANIFYFAVVQHLDPEPFPSPSDAGWLAFYPLAYACLVLLLRARVVRWHASTWLDGLVASCGLAALALALVFRAVLVRGHGSSAAVATALAYPVGDLLLLVLFVGALAVLGWRPGPAWWLLAAGLGWFVLGDVVFLFQSASPQGYTTGGWVDVTWLAGVALMAVASWGRSSERPPGRMDGWGLLAVPLLFAATSVALLLASSLSDQPDALVVWLATATICFALARTALTFRELRHLAEARQQAGTDELTGLANRRALLEQVGATAGDLDAGTCPRFALLLIDLDRFKEINDSFGHPVGDQLLRLIGPRLSQALARGGTVARMGGDEFAVLLRGADEAAASRVAREFNVALREAFELEGMPLHIDASIGIALAPEHGATTSVLLQRADLAMYAAKRGKLGYTVYRPGNAGEARHRLLTLEELRTALDREQLVVHYQPKLDLASGRVVGAEALVRWQHPDRGLVFPDGFLPLAEQAGLMRRVALQVLEQSLRDVRSWRLAGHDVHVAVNLSVSNLQDIGLPGQVGLLLDALGVPASALVLEITEDILMADAERSKQVLHGLKALGVRLAVDDYGTGYSSLAYLRELPVHELKLDRSFVTHLRTDPRSAAIVRSTVQLSHELGMVMVAEGVEDGQVLAALSDWKCDLAQGYHIARPMSEALFVDWLAAHSEQAATSR